MTFWNASVARRAGGVVLAAVWLFTWADMAASAQTATPSAPSTVAAPIPALPAAAASVPVSATAPAPAEMPMPPLPPSSPCNKRSIVGLWKLMQVYESPAQTQTALFASKPVQFLFLRPNSTFGKYADQTDLPPPAIRKKINEEKTSLQQYVVNDQGFVYFYQDRVAVDTQACFIVAKPTANFKKGQMLLMPPQGQSSIRLVKVYQRGATLMKQPGNRRGRRGRRNNPNR